MKKLFGLFALLGLILGCSEVSKEKRPLVEMINKKVDDIDANHRVSIVEDDFHEGDSIYKIRGYFMEEQLQKVVGVLNTSHVERIDYFYFEYNRPIFSGHVVVSHDSHVASEYKFYYGSNGKVEESLRWIDHYEKGKRFPHEHFEEFEPDIDSLHQSEKVRLKYFLSKLDLDGVEIRHLNENLDANVRR